MSLKFDLGAALANAVKAGVAAVILGGGTMVLKNSGETALLKQRVEQGEVRANQRDVVIEKLDDSVRSLDKNVAILNERLKD